MPGIKPRQIDRRKMFKHTHLVLSVREVSGKDTRLNQKRMSSASPGFSSYSNETLTKDLKSGLMYEIRTHVHKMIYNAQIGVYKVRFIYNIVVYFGL